MENFKLPNEIEDLFEKLKGTLVDRETCIDQCKQKYSGCKELCSGDEACLEDCRNELRSCLNKCPGFTEKDKTIIEEFLNNLDRILKKNIS